jgi:lipopolysaccharide export system permease protein
LKKLDKYLISIYIGPFFVSFLIALFVLMMQIVWVYVDDIMGKGAGILFISEMIFYMSMLMVPMAMVIGVLIASVMSVGNLAEHYELSSMKSAGVSLLRVMLPLTLFCCVLSVFSFFTSDVLTPWAKLKQNARLYDLRRQKPALAIEEGVFSDNFAGYTLRIGKKDHDDKTIHDVMIYQQNPVNAGMSELLAKGGEMELSADKSCLVMKLNEGRRYENLKDDGKRRFAYVRTNFEEWNKIFVLEELERTDESLFKSGQATKSVNRLFKDIDSIGGKVYERKEEFAKSVEPNFTAFKEPVKKDSSISVVINRDANGNLIQREPTQQKLTINNYEQPIAQNLPENMSSAGSILTTFVIYKQVDLINRTKVTIESIKQMSENSEKSIERIKESQAKHICEMESRFLFAALCIIFLFIGAPMGAIVRKGGFGYPFLIAIGFFIVFIFMYIMFRKLGEQGTINPYIAVWIPGIILSLIGAFLTKKAMNDEQLFKTGRWNKFVSFIKRRKKITA